MAGEPKRNTYNYDALPSDTSIRLLQLLPTKEDQEPECHLFTVDIHHAPPYEAVSYVWGSPTDKTTILCHGQPVTIPNNLLHCLRSCRSPAHARILWADSICINQADLRERAQQVRLMGAIFARAERVLVWFGRGHDFAAPDAFAFLRALASVCPAQAESRFSPADEARIHARAAALPAARWRAFAALMRNAWATRGWVLQEIGLARAAVLVCGAHAADWREMLRVVDALRWCCPRLIARYGVDMRVRLAGVFDFRDAGRPVARVVHLARNFETTDPRDKVYALLGHPGFREANGRVGEAERIPVDYELSCEEVYLATARFLLKAGSPFALLSFVGHSRETMKEEQSASWVPRWSNPYRTKALNDGFRIYHDAARGTEPQLTQVGRSLEVKGLRVDRIKWKSELLTKENVERSVPMAEEQRNTLAHLWEEVCSLAGKERPIEDLFRAFCLTLNAGNFIRSGIGARQRLSAEERFADCLTYFVETSIPLKPQAALRELYGTGHFWRFLETIKPCHERSFFVTDQGYLGIGPEVANPGDEVCIPFGSPTPFILRPQEKGGHRLCGECYTYGLMEGQTIEAWKTGKIREQTFVIS